jgi:hypothetical protein
MDGARKTHNHKKRKQNKQTNKDQKKKKSNDKKKTRNEPGNHETTQNVPQWLLHHVALF